MNVFCRICDMGSWIGVWMCTHTGLRKCLIYICQLGNQLCKWLICRPVTSDLRMSFAKEITCDTQIDVVLLSTRSGTGPPVEPLRKAEMTVTDGTQWLNERCLVVDGRFVNSVPPSIPRNRDLMGGTSTHRGGVRRTNQDYKSLMFNSSSFLNLGLKQLSLTWHDNNLEIAVHWHWVGTYQSTWPLGIDQCTVIFKLKIILRFGNAQHGDNISIIV